MIIINILLYGTLFEVLSTKVIVSVPDLGEASGVVFFFSRTTTHTMITAMTARIAIVVPAMTNSKCGGAAGSSMMVGMNVVLEIVDDGGDSGLLVETLLIVEHIEPGESINMSSCCAFELTQVTPQSLWLKDVAPSNMLAMLIT